jgi:hemoglobin
MSEHAEPSTVYAEIGPEKLGAIVAAFYRQVPGDDLLAPLYPPDVLAGAEDRLRDFLLFRCGGTARYLETRGHPKLRMRHAPFRITPAVRDRWVQLMDRALDELTVQLRWPPTWEIRGSTHAGFRLHVGPGIMGAVSRFHADALPLVVVSDELPRRDVLQLVAMGQRGVVLVRCEDEQFAVNHAARLRGDHQFMQPDIAVQHRRLDVVVVTGEIVVVDLSAAERAEDEQRQPLGRRHGSGSL